MINILIFLVIVGVLLYILSLLPLDALIKKIIYILAILFTLIYVLRALGFIGGHIGL